MLFGNPDQLESGQFFENWLHCRIKNFITKTENKTLVEIAGFTVCAMEHSFWNKYEITRLQMKKFLVNEIFCVAVEKIIKFVLCMFVGSADFPFA